MLKYPVKRNKDEVKGKKQLYYRPDVLFNEEIFM